MRLNKVIYVTKILAINYKIKVVNYVAYYICNNNYC